MNRTALIEVKNVFGNELIYPRNEVAQIFAKIAGKKTLSNTDLLDMERLGFDICHVAPAFPIFAA